MYKMTCEVPFFAGCEILCPTKEIAIKAFNGLTALLNFAHDDFIPYDENTMEDWDDFILGTDMIFVEKLE